VNDRSRCQTVLLESCLTRVCEISSAVWYCGLGAVQIAFGLQHVAELITTDRQIALPGVVAGVLFDQGVQKLQRTLLLRFGGVQIALGLQYVAQAVIADRQIAPPHRVARLTFN